ncbi:3-deoxy-D-manno-octulosonic acid transferase [Hyunsoonleella sp. SJ7]|uniref:3-deoxy-D-manno-octulosonic acid transferase n=1 Tax=Hyunsoonleella aquatilis TaxID=2762758 RepID=A0A923KK40_9FLAO|nr:glycosyltransferase N-terminal domain-containing protein [Hyunsoonleella aquatilis]MBC3758092.1 3-deoxy-D-manno-octulosonic acid transferase [Hyunsoonleella aquatilis]
MRFIYNIGIGITGFVLKCIGLFNEKIKKGVTGRNAAFEILKSNLCASDKTLWFHCASLGEYEQGLPVFQKLRKHYYDYKIILSFFSPSGYDIRKNSPIADVVVYLPLDTKRNAKRFLDLVHPKLTLFVKYDIWPNFLKELGHRNLRAILISASFRKTQIYFKPYGGLFKKALLSFEHIFTQNESSKSLLESIGYQNVTVSGDTRFDRVTSQLESDNTLGFVEAFKQDKLCVVVGSSWPEDEALFIEFINSRRNLGVKYIVAPHNIKSGQIQNFASKLRAKTVLYSEKDNEELKHFDVLIIDTIGLLSKIYSSSDIAYVGGAMGTTGLHNILEPAVFGPPIVIGKNYIKFPEAQAMIDNGGVFSVSDQMGFNAILRKLIADSDFRRLSGSKNTEFIKKNTGAVIQILNYLRI